MKKFTLFTEEFFTIEKAESSLQDLQPDKGRKESNLEVFAALILTIILCGIILLGIIMFA